MRAKTGSSVLIQLSMVPGPDFLKYNYPNCFGHNETLEWFQFTRMSVTTPNIKSKTNPIVPAQTLNLKHEMVNSRCFQDLTLASFHLSLGGRRYVELVE